MAAGSKLGDIVVFLDADGDIHPRMIKRLLPFLEDFDVVVGAKDYSGMSRGRKVLMLLSRIYIKLMFNLDFTTQTGIKAMKIMAIPLWRINGYLFDVEWLVKAKKQGMKIIEIPVQATVVRKKSFKVIWQALMESIKIWFRLLFRKDVARI